VKPFFNKDRAPHASTHISNPSLINNFILYYSYFFRYNNCLTLSIFISVLLLLSLFFYTFSNDMCKNYVLYIYIYISY